jgi:hypothetical protein
VIDTSVGIVCIAIACTDQYIRLITDIYIQLTADIDGGIFDNILTAGIFIIAIMMF